MAPAMVVVKVIVVIARVGERAASPVVVRVDIMLIAPIRMPRAVVAVVREPVFVVIVLAAAEFVVPPVPVVAR